LEKFSVDDVHQLNISQPEKGYRFSLDSLILAAHIHPKGNETVMDVGCGCGVISLILARRYPDLKITGIEIQEELYDFARKNILANGFEKNIRVFHEDIRTLQSGRIDTGVDIIVSNPPYKKLGTGRVNPDPQRAVARHETALSIDALVECSSRLISDQGLFFVIFPFDRLPDLSTALTRHQFYPEFIRPIHIKPGTKAKRVIVRAVKSPITQCSLPSPFFIYSPENKFTEEYLSLFRS
jgi:tRNA1Val (adenine37-N6)-methyltransferase